MARSVNVLLRLSLSVAHSRLSLSLLLSLLDACCKALGQKAGSRTARLENLPPVPNELFQLVLGGVSVRESHLSKEIVSAY